jgi:hypothetical protein
MDRREFFEKSGCGVFALMLSHFGFKAYAKGLDQDKPNRLKKIKEALLKMGKTEEEVEAMMKELEEKLPKVKTTCICKSCPSYVKDETELGFCHPFIGKSKIITEERGCNCPQCPVYKEMKLKNGYYCTRKSEMEQEYAKKMKKG